MARPKKRVAIVGAGPGGLAAAMLLSQAGAEVTMFERHDRVGGRSATLSGAVPPGEFRFDMGPTFFLYPRVLQDVFAACGRRLEDEVELIRLDPQYRLQFEDGERLDATSDPVRMAEQIAKFSPTDALAFGAYMADNRAKLAAFRPILESAFNGMRDVLRPKLARSLPLLRPHRSVDQDLGRYFKNEKVRLAFSFQSKYLGMSPFRCPSLFTILSFMEYEYGVWHPRGGCGAVMSAMARVAQDLGTEIKTEAPVETLLFQGRRATGVRVGGKDLSFDAVVINADFAQAMTKLVPDDLRRRWTDRRIASKKYSCSTFMLYLGIEGQVPELAHHTVYLSREYRRNVSEIDAGMAPPTDASFYVQNACVTDPDMAPLGHSTLYVLVPVGNRVAGGADWPKVQAEFRAQTLKRLERIGIPDLSKRIRFEKMMTPRDWEDDMGIYRGATFNLAHSMGQILHNRPRNRFEDLESVYLVGGGTHPGSGLPVIFESARITSRLIAADLELQPRRASPQLVASENLLPRFAEALAVGEPVPS
jgi:phytoene desaturase